MQKLKSRNPSSGLLSTTLRQKHITSDEKGWPLQYSIVNSSLKLRIAPNLT